MNEENIRSIVDNLVDDTRRTPCDYQLHCSEYKKTEIPEGTIIRQNHPLAKCFFDLDKVQRSTVCQEEFRNFITNTYYELMNSNVGNK